MSGEECGVGAVILANVISKTQAEICRAIPVAGGFGEVIRVLVVARAIVESG